MAQHLDFYRANAPGFENAFLMLSAPQLGVRHSRRLVGVRSITRAQTSAIRIHKELAEAGDVIRTLPSALARSTAMANAPIQSLLLGLGLAWPT